MRFKLYQLLAIDATFRGMNNLRRWTEYFQEARYSELSKQALNCIVTFIIAKKSEETGKNIQWERFPKIAIFRGFQKMGLADVTHSTYANIVEKKMGKNLEDFYQVVGKNKIRELIAEAKNGMESYNAGQYHEDTEEAKELEEFLLEGVDTYEFEIYRVSSRIATLIELMENEAKFNRNEYATTYLQITNDIKKMEKKIPAVMGFIESNEFNLIRRLSALRNQNRWAVRSYPAACSVLGHLFDTGVFAYIIAINSGMSEELATKMFFIGIWHDVVEKWTKDVPSPTKDSIEGFREASEEFEIECIQKYIYNVLDDEYIRQSIQNVMMEEEVSSGYKKLLKAADYLAADSECYRQLLAGSRDKYFRDKVLYGDLKKIQASNDQYISGDLRELLKYWIKETKDLHLLG